MKLDELVAKMSMSCAVKIELVIKPEVSEIIYERHAYANSVVDMKGILYKYGKYHIRYITVDKNYVNRDGTSETYEEPCLHICISDKEEL